MVAAAKGRRKVDAPKVQVRLDDGRSVQFDRGDVLPDNVSKESLDLLEDLGYLSSNGDGKK